MNWQRGSFEMIQAWRAKGTAKTEMLRKWMEDPSVAHVTAEMVFSESFQESCPKFSCADCSTSSPALPGIHMSFFKSFF